MNLPAVFRCEAFAALKTRVVLVSKMDALAVSDHGRVLVERTLADQA